MKPLLDIIILATITLLIIITIVKTITKKYPSKRKLIEKQNQLLEEQNKLLSNQQKEV